ncbi:MAG: tyrosine-type recombinase/integrase [Streptosporangiaceae bacterium]
MPMRATAPGAARAATTAHVRPEHATPMGTPRDWFRRQIWQPAAKRAGLDIHVRMHHMRHAHASWLLAGGADLQVVKERLGHASIATTEKYPHSAWRRRDGAGCTVQDPRPHGRWPPPTPAEGHWKRERDGIRGNTALHGSGHSR